MWPPIPLYDGDQIVEQPVNLSTLTARYTQKMLESLDELAKTKQPFFLHLAYEIPHVPLPLPLYGSRVFGVFMEMSWRRWTVQLESSWTNWMQRD